MTTRDVSKAQETQVAKYLNGNRTANSGATSFSKGDVLTKDCIIECKTKMHAVEEFQVRKEWLTKLEQERRDMGKRLSALAISFDTGSSSFYIIDQATMRYLLEMHEAQDGCG